MDLRPSELQEILQTSAADFFEREVSFERIREIEAAGRPDEQLQDQLTELGWNSLAISEAYGGQGGTVLDAGVLINQICRAALPSPLASTLVGAVTIERHGDEALKTSLLPQLDSGLTISAALLEASDSLYGPVTAEYAGGVLTGEKRFVEFGETSAVHLVAAMHGSAPGLAVVRRDQAGVTARDTRTIGALPQATVNYDGAAAEAWIEGEDAIETLRRLGSAVAAFESYAYAQKALDLTVDYVQMRVQFGQPIGAFQAVQMRCADMATIVEGSRFLTHELLWQIDKGLETRRQVAIVKAITAKMAPQVLQDCHLLHGGIGYMQEYDLHFFTRRGGNAGRRAALGHRPRDDEHRHRGGLRRRDGVTAVPPPAGGERQGEGPAGARSRSLPRRHPRRRPSSGDRWLRRARQLPRGARQSGRCCAHHPHHPSLPAAGH